MIVGVALLAAFPARAAVQTRLRAAWLAGAGADDNVLFDGRGGDAVGRTTLRLEGRAHDRLWSAQLLAAPTLLGFAQAQRFALLGELRGSARARPDRHVLLATSLRLRAADDPLALAQIGLMASHGRTLAFRAEAHAQVRPSRPWTLDGALRLEGVRFLEPQPTLARDGESVGMALRAGRRLDRTLRIDSEVLGRLFLTRTATTAGLGWTPGLRWRLARRTFVEAAAGPQFYRDDTGTLPGWTGRVRAQWAGRALAAELTAAHDLTVPAGRGGVSATDFAEAVGRWATPDVEARLRLGAYFSRSSPRADAVVPGAGGEAAMLVRVAPSVWVGGSVLRFERLATAAEPSLVRNAVYAWFAFTGDRP